MNVSLATSLSHSYRIMPPVLKSMISPHLAFILITQTELKVLLISSQLTAFRACEHFSKWLNPSFSSLKDLFKVWEHRKT